MVLGKQVLIATILSIIIAYTNANTDLHVQSKAQEKSRPQKIKFPDSFEIGISTNDPGLNITEVIYYDGKAQKIRLQVFYSLLGLEPSKAVDLVLDEGNKVVAIQSDGEGDCKYTSFHESLAPIGLFFSMFNALTDYQGLDKNGLHQYQVKSLAQGEQDSRFFFLFDQDGLYQKSRIESTTFGFEYNFDTVKPMSHQNFSDADWQQKDCEQIETTILTEGNNFTSFMYQFFLHIVGSEEEMLAQIGLTQDDVDQIKPIFRPGDKSNNNGQASDDDEDFDEGESQEILQ